MNTAQFLLCRFSGMKGKGDVVGPLGFLVDTNVIFLIPIIAFWLFQFSLSKLQHDSKDLQQVKFESD